MVVLPLACFTEDKQVPQRLLHPTPIQSSSQPGVRRLSYNHRVVASGLGLLLDLFVLVLDQPLPSSNTAPGTAETRVGPPPPNTTHLLQHPARLHQPSTTQEKPVAPHRACKGCHRAHRGCGGAWQRGAMALPQVTATNAASGAPGLQPKDNCYPTAQQGQSCSPHHPPRCSMALGVLGLRPPQDPSALTASSTPPSSAGASRGRWGGGAH